MASQWAIREQSAEDTCISACMRFVYYLTGCIVYIVYIVYIVHIVHIVYILLLSIVWHIETVSLKGGPGKVLVEFAAQLKNPRQCQCTERTIMNDNH